MEDHCGSHNYKISQYADDSVVVVKSFDEILTVLTLLGIFGELAGLRINIDKTKIMGLGSLKSSVKNVHNIEVVTCIKTLGIYVGHNKKLCIDRNWSDKITKIKLLLQRWQERSLTLLGKIVIIKSLALPIIAYSVSNYETLPWVIKNVNSLFFNSYGLAPRRLKEVALLVKLTMVA